jgi:hypothetical protein
MKKLIETTRLEKLTKEEQKRITGGGPYDDPCNQYWQTCCSTNDDCMDPMSEDNGISYSVCEGNYCVEYFW